LYAALGLIALLAAACGGGSGDEITNKPAGDAPSSTARVRGGSIIVGIEAETNSWLPGSANFSNAGINVALSIYDPLMRRAESGEIRPYLAKSLQPNSDLTEWTLELRPGVNFHDGTALDATAIKTVFDTYIKASGSNRPEWRRGRGDHLPEHDRSDQPPRLPAAPRAR
jgi:peptide/nickel transport system substrate-binding protein